MSGVLDWLDRLADPACYPHRPPHVEIVQTHISVVCLAGDRVYKLKKPVTLPFLDFATLAQRRFCCEEELRLNRRLCPDVYLDVVPLVRGARGVAFANAGDALDGEVLDWAVRMVRLPAERMLDRLLREHAVTTDEIEALARTIAAFHARADRGPEVQAAGAPDRLATFARANFTELQAVPCHGLDMAQARTLRQQTDHDFTWLLHGLAARSERDFAALLPKLRDRAATGHVVDGHGDLHARNICMTAPPTIYDCIEFSAAFRCGDVATEHAFLVMDLVYRGAAELAAAYVRAVVAATGDRELPTLLPPLVAYRAMVRAKVAALTVGEPEMDAADRAQAQGSVLAHLYLAARSAIEASGPWWLVLCGLPASGKSVLARELVKALGVEVVATDVVRKELAGVPPRERLGAAGYTAAHSDRTYAEVARRAAVATATGARIVVLDGNFAEPARRAAAQQAATAAGARALVVAVILDDAVARERLATRSARGGAVSDAGIAEFELLRARFQPPTASEGPLLALDGALSPLALAVAVLGDLLAR